MTVFEESSKYNLPVQTTPFIGREEELRAISRFLNEPLVRLVTLLGPGGMGKTRLALALAHQELSRYRDGCYFVPLASLASADSIMPAIANSLNLLLRFGVDPVQQVLEYLRTRELLLVLDNYEHLLDDAVLTTTILEAAPCVQVVVTSRQRLHLSSETIYRVGKLEVPEREQTIQLHEYSSIQLFVQRATQLRPDWQPSNDDLTKIARICDLVQGMPLAIILAASWMNILSLEEIAEEIKRDLNFLNAALRDIPERLHSVRAVFEGTWKCMTVEERQAFQRLSLFRGGCERDALTHVTDVDLHVLQGLVDKALIIHTNVGRYEIHDLLRQYGENQLAQDEQEYSLVRALHCHYFASLTLRHYETLHVSETKQWLTLMDIELDNLQFGWDWAIQTKNHDALWQFSKLYLYYSLRCRYVEGEAIFARTVASLQNDVSDEQSALLLARLLAFHAYLCHYNIEIDKMLDKYRQCSRILRQMSNLGKNRETAAILYFLGSSLYFIRPVEARRLLEECIAYCEQYNHRDALMVAARMNRLAFVSSLATEVDEVKAGLSQARELDYLRGRALFTKYQAMLTYWLEHDHSAAFDWMEQAIALHRRCDDPINLAGALVTRADIELASHRYTDAHTLLLEALTLFDEHGCLPWVLIPTLVCAARLFLTLEDMQGAAEVCACVQDAPFLNQPRLYPMNLIWNTDTHLLWQKIKTDLNKDMLEEAMERGSNLTLVTAIQRTLELLRHLDLTSVVQSVETKRHVMNNYLSKPLTPREFDVFLLICAGYSNKDIADELVISKNTLKTHIKRLYDKLNVRDRTQALLRGQEFGLLEK